MSRYFKLISTFWNCFAATKRINSSFALGLSRAMIFEGLLNLYSNTLKNPFSGLDYYLIALKNEDKNSIIGIFSSWVDFAKEDNNKEVRRIDLVIPEDVKKDLILLEKYPLIVNNKEELTSFLKFGGYALVDKKLIQSHLNEIATPIVCSSSIDKGFVQYETLPLKNKNRFAKDKFRAEIIDRDNYQCRVCGSSPDDSVHVRLEVHHIKPWEEGGLTLKENLITLCNACHLDAENFDRRELYKKIGIRSYYQNSTFFAPLEKYTSKQFQKAIYLASNIVEIMVENKYR